ncbi:MAG: glycosyltransferase family 2 protein [Anaerolineae bacterium]|nr:glycosyltransferase family 2 protein [Candidatus Roseilinea sp.]MDW8449507.1 glycosyltransferase family 2 protein [Anaerolineae bacterium]
MKVSVVIPTYNRAELLPEAIASVRQQDYPDLEIIVVDDGSTDRTPEVVRALGRDIHFVRLERNHGVATARNVGVSLASGDAIAFLDSDDLWPPDKLRIQAQRMHMDVDIVLGKTQLFCRNQSHGAFTPRDSPFSSILLGSALIRRALFDTDKVGLFDEALRQHEDLDWFMRVREQRVNIVLHDEVTLHYRLHGNSLTRDDQLRFIADKTMFLTTFKRSLERRRGMHAANMDPPSRPSTQGVSVIVPVRNQAQYLAEAIESVLGQTRRPDEIIVVDDGSTDDAMNVALRYAAHIRYVYQPPRGAPTARNRGLGLAAGDVIAFLDADDIWLPAKLEMQLAVLEARPEVDMVFCHAEQFVSEDAQGAVAHIPDRLRRLPAVYASGMLVRRAAFEQVGLFDKRYVRADVIDWIARARQVGLTEATLPNVLVRRRWHATNLGRMTRSLDNEYAHTAKAALDRRRGIHKS